MILGTQNWLVSNRGENADTDAVISNICIRIRIMRVSILGICIRIRIMRVSILGIRIRIMHLLRLLNVVIIRYPHIRY
jgi:hypothetical protein